MEQSEPTVDAQKLWTCAVDSERPEPTAPPHHPGDIPECRHMVEGTSHWGANGCTIWCSCGLIKQHQQEELLAAEVL